MKSDQTKALVIVESPAKAKTIEKYLGDGYTVAASVGHLIDLPKSRMAIDVEHGFEPEYITVRGKAKILRELQKLARRTRNVLLASDNDREGEAISYHIRNALLKRVGDLTIRRIVFNEITPGAIREAVAAPAEDLDEAKVSAQKARRVLDRLVGYNLSPLLWEKVKNGLSAGRVQSVALRMICDREAEVESFVAREYWTLEAELSKGRTHFRALLIEYDGKKPHLRDENDALAVVEHLKDATFQVVASRSVKKTLKPRPPLTTSKMQQVAATRFGFTSRKTMQIAQQLYEGVNVGSRRVGLITYVRTDSTRISASALEQVRAFIAEHHACELPAKPQIYAAGGRTQDAHEAIRPTYVEEIPERVKTFLTRDQHRLYSIIWERFVSSQMSPAKSVTQNVDLAARGVVFRANATKIVVQGFQKVLKVLAGRDKVQKLPSLAEGEHLVCNDFHPEQHFTTGPSRYTDATMVKALDEKGIGRPSTYAPIISVLLDRYYVTRKNRQLSPTQLGKIISDILARSFPEIVDVGFTARLEQQLDEIEEANTAWVDVVSSFYQPFKQRVEDVMQNLESIKGIMDEPTEYRCDKCGRPMLKKLGRYGFFLACSGFPECRSTGPVPLADCPREGCGGRIVARRRQGSRGKEFYGCTNFPECEFVTHHRPIEQKCPRCGSFMVERETKRDGSVKSCINPECDYLHIPEPGVGEKSA